MSIGINSLSTSPADMFSVTPSPVATDASVRATTTKDVPKVEEQSKNNTQATPEKQVSKDDLINMSKMMSQFLAMTNPDLKFDVHEDTNRLMVNLVDGKANKVLKTFPSKEFLDMVARIKDYVGMIVDKKA